MRTSGELNISQQHFNLVAAAKALEIPLDRDVFTRTLIRELAGALEDVVGIDRIQGNFFIIEEHEDKIVLGNTACPFAEKVIGRRSMSMMTSNVFGHIASQR
jgi:hypothetical protein